MKRTLIRLNQTIIQTFEIPVSDLFTFRLRKIETSLSQEDFQSENDMRTGGKVSMGVKKIVGIWVIGVRVVMREILRVSDDGYTVFSSILL